MNANNGDTKRTHRQPGDSSRNNVFNGPIRGYVDSVTNAEIVTGFVQNIFYIQIGDGGTTVFSDSAPDHQSGQEVHNLVLAIMRLQNQAARRREDANANSGQDRREHPPRARSL